MDKKIEHDASVDAQMEKRAVVKIVRDSSKTIQIGSENVGQITNYKYKILVRDKPTIEGSLSREEVDLMFRLYSAEGSNLTQRSVSRYFPSFTFQDFKKVLRAFNITKASSPLAPHVIEEKPKEELAKLTFENKENDYLRYLEQNRTKLTEVKLREMTGKYYDLKQQIADFKEFIGDLNFDIKIEFKKPEKTNEKTIIVYLSDMHIGAAVSPYSIYENEFSFETATKRLQRIYEKIVDLAVTTGATNIIVCNIGDTLDGYNGETTRGGHALPQNMNNKDQFKNFLKMMTQFFADISTSGFFSSIKYIAVDGGNHDGDFGYMANKALEGILGILNPEINVTIFEKYIEYFRVDNHTFVVCHGKDAKDVFKNMPLVINDKTENQINEFLDYNAIYGKNVHFIKGDLHQSATTYANRFRYKSVASFFGSSEWIHKNFGNTKAAVDIDIIDGDSILETRLVLN
jgi:hypothetical protein